MNLVQGNMTVGEYELRLTELSWYAPHIIVNEEEKTKKFQDNLAPSIHGRIAHSWYKTMQGFGKLRRRPQGRPYI